MKMKMFVILAALSVTATATAEPLGYPGSTWGVLTFPSSVINGTPEDDNWLYQGRVVQGVDWFKFGSEEDWLFNTYGAFGFSVDRNQLDYNNKLVPAVGAKVSRYFDNGVVDFGVEGVYERHFGDVEPAATNPDRDGFGVQAYVSYWFGWNLKK